MKKLILLCAILFASAAIYAQSAPLTVKNGTGCAFWVYGYASPGGCGLVCNTGPICCPPGVATVIPPCGPASWQWDVSRIIPTDDACTTPCPGTASLGVRPPGSTCPFPTVAIGNHCACGPYTADFASYPNVLYLL